jgi:hypothetical protein
VVKKSRFIALLFGLSLILANTLPARSSGTTTPATSTGTSTPTTPAATGPTTLKSIGSSLTGTDIRVKATRQLDITAIYTNGTKQTVTDKCTFTSSDEKVATVSATGLVTAIYDGRCYITISYTEKGVTQTASVSVGVYSGFLGQSP